METDRLPFNQGFAVPTESSSSCALPIMAFGKISPLTIGPHPVGWTVDKTDEGLVYALFSTLVQKLT